MPTDDEIAKLQQWIDREITPRAVETAAKLMTDQAAYGFAAINERGERVDPRTLKPSNESP